MKLKLLYCFLTLFISFQAFENAAAKNTSADDNIVGSLTGTVTDKADGKPIPGATVSVPDLKIGTVTDANGKYTLNRLPKGVYLVQVSFVGYGTFNQRLDLSKETVLDV